MPVTEPVYEHGILGLAPAAYWRMGEASGDIADSTANANTGTAAGSPTYGAVGPIDGTTAITFPDNDATRFSAATSVSLNLADTFSVSGWFRKTENGTFMSIVSRAANGYSIRFSDANVLQLEKNGVATIVNGTKAITDTRWHSFAVTKATTTTRLFIDGEDCTGTVSNQTIVATGGETRIGSNPNDAVNGPWDGDLGHLAVFSVALSADSITRISRRFGDAPYMGSGKRVMNRSCQRLIA